LDQTNDGYKRAHIPKPANAEVGTPAQLVYYGGGYADQQQESPGDLPGGQFVTLMWIYYGQINGAKHFSNIQYVGHHGICQPIEQ
jgi:hypothetical protein